MSVSSTDAFFYFYFYATTVRQIVVCCTLIKVMAFCQQSCFVSSLSVVTVGGFVFDVVVVFCGGGFPPFFA